MSIRTKIANLRADMKVRQETENANAVMQVKSLAKRTPMFMFGFALAFAAMLTALFGQPASAALDLNSTIGPILDGVSNLIPSIVSLIVAVVPAIIVLAVVGFIVAFLDKILAMLKF